MSDQKAPALLIDAARDASHALIDMEVDGWGEAVETNPTNDGRVVVMFERTGPGQSSCTCDQEDYGCDYCVDPPATELLQITVEVVEVSRGYA